MASEKVLFRNLNIINPFGTPAYQENGYILCSNGRITQVGSIPPDTAGIDRIFDMSGKTLLPGMVNLHTHLYSSLALGMPAPVIKPENFVAILRQIWWKLDLALDQNSTIASFQAGLLANLRAGVPTSMDHHYSQNFIRGSTDLLVDQADSFGIRLGTAFEVTDRNGPERFTAGLEENIDAMKQYADHSHVHPMTGLHASFTLSDPSLRTIAGRMQPLEDAAIHIHVAEDRTDLEDANRHGYTSSLNRLREFGLIRPGSLLIHGIHIPEDEYTDIRDAGAYLIHCPTSNAGNQVGMLSNLALNNVSTGLGTDGKNADMVDEVNFAEVIRFNDPENSRSFVDYARLLFENNPRIASSLFQQKIGRIEPGFQADMVFFDYHPHTTVNEDNFIDHVKYGFGKPADVITRGKFRIKNNNLVRMDEEEILANSRRESVKLWNEMRKIR